MPISKPVFPLSPTFTHLIDDTYSDEEHIYVEQVEGATETDRKLNAASQAGVQVGDAHKNTELLAAHVHALSISVQLLQDAKALVIVRWGVPVDPIPDGPWIFETFNSARTVRRGLDRNHDPIKVKYVPPYVGDAEVTQFLTVNEREFNRGAVVTARDDLIHVVGRRQISYEAMGKMSPNPWTWPYRYVNYVNKELPLEPGNGWYIEKGVWFCNSLRVYTRNQMWSVFVDVEFVYNWEGWEEFVLFTYRDGTRPPDLDIPGGMKTPWPTVRESTDRPYGAVRPNTIKGTKNFGAAPLDFKLGGFLS